jgi:hypothetical protein
MSFCVAKKLCNVWEFETFWRSIVVKMLKDEKENKNCAGIFSLFFVCV